MIVSLPVLGYLFVILFIVVSIYWLQSKKKSKQSTSILQTINHIVPKQIRVTYKSFESLTADEKIEVIRIWKECYPDTVFNFYNPGGIAIAWLQNTIIGYCGYLTSDKLCNWINLNYQNGKHEDYGAKSCNDKGIYFYNLCLSESYRNQQYEHKLIKQMMRRLSASYFYTWCKPNDKSLQSFYKTIGFHIQKQTSQAVILQTS